MKLPARLLGFLIGLDEALNALGGGRARETISGSCGRGLIAGRWWAPTAVCLVDGVFGPGHCVQAAMDEAGRRVAGRA